jgi:hypothetical protein
MDEFYYSYKKVIFFETLEHLGCCLCHSCTKYSKMEVRSEKGLIRNSPQFLSDFVGA